MNCTSCGAPLPPKERLCRYCHRLNDVDLRAICDRVESGAATDRICPHCSQPLCAVHLQARETFTVDRCDQCLGIFFDLGELEVLLDKSVANVHRIDHERLETLIEKESRVAARPVRYIKCPVCRAHMNRRKYGSRTQVIVDACKDHGLWLDGGELSQLLQWMKAGGQLHDDLRRREEHAARERAERVERRLGPPLASRELDAPLWGRGLRPLRDFDLGDILRTALDIIS